MEKIPPVESVMTSFVLSVGIDEPVRVAEDIMTDHEVRHLAVTDARYSWVSSRIVTLPSCRTKAMRI